MAAAERVLAIDADIVRRAKDPATEILLPWLAWEETVDVWDPDWPVERKREAIARSWHLPAPPQRPDPSPASLPQA